MSESNGPIITAESQLQALLTCVVDSVRPSAAELRRHLTGFTTEPITLRSGAAWVFRLSFFRPDTSRAGVSGVGVSRDYIVRRGATVASVLGSVYLALRTYMEHEVLEGFAVLGVRPFDPHQPLHRLLGFNRGDGQVSGLTRVVDLVRLMGPGPEPSNENPFGEPEATPEAASEPDVERVVVVCTGDPEDTLTLIIRDGELVGVEVIYDNMPRTLPLANLRVYRSAYSDGDRYIRVWAPLGGVWTFCPDRVVRARLKELGIWKKLKGKGVTLPG